MTNKPNSLNKSNKSKDTQTMTRMHPSMKRPRAPIACYRCHHKKVRCDGIHPNCTRCLSTGVLCAYPSSRRSRNTQPTNVDPFINNLSQLEAKIRRIESDLESQRSLVHTLCESHGEIDKTNANTLNSCIVKTEKDLQESRSIVAQLRLRGEQRAARGRRQEKKEKKPLDDYLIPNTFQDWSMLNTRNNGFIDPMIIAAAENSMPLLYINDGLSHLQAREIPGLQPSCSSTSTCSSSSFVDPNILYDDSYSQFMSNTEMMMIDQMTKN